MSVYPWPPEKQIAETTTAPRLRVQVAYAESILARDAVAEEKFRIALATAQAEWPFYVARMTQSRAALREAAGRFDALGLLRYAERARRELWASGETFRHRDPGAWHGLALSREAV